MRFEFSKTRHAQYVSFAPPGSVPKPQRVRMSRTLRPRRVNELIMHVLLSIVDDALNVARDVIDELPKSDRVAQDQLVMTRSHCCAQIMNKQPDDLFLVGISDGHFRVPKVGLVLPRCFRRAFSFDGRTPAIGIGTPASRTAPARRCSALDHAEAQAGKRTTVLVEAHVQPGAATGLDPISKPAQRRGVVLVPVHKMACTSLGRISNAKRQLGGRGWRTESIEYLLLRLSAMNASHAVRRARAPQRKDRGAKESNGQCHPVNACVAHRVHGRGAEWECR